MSDNRALDVRKAITEEFGDFALMDNPLRAEWFQAVVAVISALASAISANDTKHWQEDVSSKLDLIIQMQEQILNDLRQLRVDIDRMLENQTRRELISGIGSKQGMLEDVLKGIPTFDKVPDSLKSKLKYIANETDDQTRQLKDMGFVGYHFVALGFAVVAGANRALKLPQKTFYAICDRYTQYFQDAIDVTKPRSLAERLAYARFAVEKYNPFFDRFDQLVGGDKGGRVTEEAGIYNVCLTGWQSGNRHDGYNGRAFDGAVGPKSLFPRFNASNPNDFWPAIDPGDAYARGHWYEILEATNTLAGELRWATPSVPTLDGAVKEVNEVIVQIKRIRESYPNFK